LLTLAAPGPFDPAQVEPRAPGIWRYRHTFPLPADTAPVSLGEGGTALVPVTTAGRTVFLLQEGRNPTGSFKDRGMAVLMAGLRAAGVTAAIEDSSGNAGASFAGYAARAGLQARVFVPAGASGPKRRQIEAYGAEVVAIEGPRSQAAEAAQAAAAAGAVYGSHIFNPLGLAGNATAAFEIWEQLGEAPERVILPVGHGTLLLGLHRGFLALRAAGLITRLPRLIAVQVLACAPLWAVYQYGAQGLGWVTEGATLAEGIRVVQPMRGDAVLAAVRETDGAVVIVEEDAILPARAALAGNGLYTEPTGAVAWAALDQLPPAGGGAEVVILTGHGLKSAA
ncbi:MAG: pyridoxal-phosphate dependent enzyme, partial [Anaerolineales bacterium]|nr:pyridoxal-phosphate dependent enzyme [Anaerolineales bacterium]